MATAAFNLKEKGTGNLYMGCLCDCGDILETPAMFTSAEEAKEYAKWKGLAGYHPSVHIDDSWKTRELSKFKDGRYQTPVWFDEEWFQSSKNFERYYPHIAKDQTDVIAFTDTPEKGMQDIQTRIKPGKYLQRFFSKVLTKEQIAEWSLKHTEEWGAPPKLMIASTPEEIATVYEMDSGFTSCMQKPVTHFGPLINPTRIYGMGDLELAYTVDKKGKLLARALIWKAEQKVGRIYGDGHRLRAAIKESLGWETVSDNSHYDILKGAKLERIEFEDGFLVPYIDGIAAVTDMGDHLVTGITYGHYTIGAPSNQHGMLGGQGKICNGCHETIKTRYYRVHSDRHDFEHTQRYCQKCQIKYANKYVHEEQTFYLHKHEFPQINIAIYTDEGVLVGEQREYEYFYKKPIVRDSYTGLYMTKDDAISFNGGSGFVHRFVLNQRIKSYDLFKSDYDDRYYAPDFAEKFRQVRVGDKIWTKEQADMFAYFDVSTAAYLPKPLDPNKDLFLGPIDNIVIDGHEHIETVPLQFVEGATEDLYDYEEDVLL